MLGALLLSVLLSQGKPAPAARGPLYQTERLSVGPLGLDIPVGWRRTWRFGTSRFDSPDGAAYLLIDTSSTLTPNLDPEECLDKLLRNLGGRHRWREIAVDGNPAAEQVVVENSQLGNWSVVTARYVGCDGNATWSMMFQGDRIRTQGTFEVVVRQIVESVRYEEKAKPTK
jgi:hypothetical protein